MDFFKRQHATVPVPDQEELEMLRQKNKTLEELVKVKEDELQEEKQKFAILQQKTADWKEKVKQYTTRDRTRIAELEEELTVLKTIRDTSNVGMSAELQSLVDQAITKVRDEHKQQLEKQQGELSKARVTIEEGEAKLQEVQQSLGNLQEQYIALQQRFSNEMEALTKHHDMELQQLREHQNNSEKISELEKYIRKQQEEIETLENHSNQQKTLSDEIQKELVDLRAEKERLEAQLHDSSQKLAFFKEQQKQWVENANNTKLSEEKTTQQFRETLEQRQQSGSPERDGIPSLEKLQKWKEKVKQDKIKDLENIRSLTQQLQQSKQRTQRANKIIIEIEEELKNNPPNVSHCIDLAHSYHISDESSQSNEIAPSTQSTMTSPLTVKSEKGEECDSSSTEQQNKLESALQERETLQRELDSAREELRLLREQFSSTSAEKEAELDSARE
ncbi:putative MYH7B protein, partial [Trypanosoma theileri]